MALELIHRRLGWPTKEEILTPNGVGAKVLLSFVKQKLGNTISRRHDIDGMDVGILCSNPDETEAPLAIVCNFSRKVSEESLRETHRLAWSLGYARLLITIEPHIIRTWTCYEPPENVPLKSRPAKTPEIPIPISIDENTHEFVSEDAANALHWVELLSDQFFAKHEKRFEQNTRADQMLLSNVRAIRTKLQANGLGNQDICHDLLGRIIFIQYLFDRKDTDGKAALDADRLLLLHQEGHLSQDYQSLKDILQNYEDTYRLFRWLDSKFNGDLFPGKKEQDSATKEEAWQSEMRNVQPSHLLLLARFVSGEEQIEDGQRSFWPYYSFDAIPLEFISTLYEQFVKKENSRGVHYTPPHIADLILDRVLPWEGDEWNLKVLDPSCGSGVFLVKAYQRLIYRWETAHPDQSISGRVLSTLLENNLFGVDVDPHAVRVASFSLYLTMCDKISPRNYWTEIHFPLLRDKRLIASDFFAESNPNFMTGNGMYDVVIGNPPWGRNTLATLEAQDWLEKYPQWKASYNDISSLFLGKAITLTKREGYIGLLQPASTLFKTTSDALSLQKHIFTSIRVEEIINLSSFRHILFAGANSPCFAVILNNSEATSDPFWYSSPKRQFTVADNYQLVIEPQDIQQVYASEWSIPSIWSILFWGSRRDLSLLKKLSHRPTLQLLKTTSDIFMREGIIRGNRQKYLSQILNRPRLDADQFPKADELWIDASQLPNNEDGYVDADASTNFEAFALPQLIIKQSWLKDQNRFRAGLVRAEDNMSGVIFPHTFLSVHSKRNPQLLYNACAVMNSQFAVYFLFLTSGSFSMDRNAVEAKDITKMPLPEQDILLNENTSLSEVDKLTINAFAFQEAEQILVDDLVEFTLPDSKGMQTKGRLVTLRHVIDEPEPELNMYCQAFCKVLHAAYGKDKYIGANIHSETLADTKLPVRLVSIYLNSPEHNEVQTIPMASSLLKDQLNFLYHLMLSSEEHHTAYYQRCTRSYETFRLQDGSVVLAIHIIKPDQVRYWTRSQAMNDADEVATDMIIWSTSRKNTFSVMQEDLRAKEANA